LQPAHLYPLSIKDFFLNFGTFDEKGYPPHTPHRALDRQGIQNEKLHSNYQNSQKINKIKKF